MQYTIGNKIEQWAIEAMRTAGTLPFDLQVESFNSSIATKNERLVVKAEVGERMLEGEKPYACELEVAFHTVNRSAEEADDLFAKVEASLISPVTSTYVNANFTWLLVMTESAKTTLSNQSNFRVYTRAIPLQANAV